jgi:hypothetical protein
MHIPFFRGSSDSAAGLRELRELMASGVGEGVISLVWVYVVVCVLRQ